IPPPAYVEWERMICAFRESHPLFGWILIIYNQFVVKIRRGQILDAMYSLFWRDIHHPLESRAQRARLERLGKILIDAGQQPGQMVHFFVERAQDDKGCMSRGGIASNAPHHLVSIHTGHLHIDDDAVWLFLVELLQARNTVIRDHYVIRAGHRDNTA